MAETATATAAPAAPPAVAEAAAATTPAPAAPAAPAKTLTDPFPKGTTLDVLNEVIARKDAAKTAEAEAKKTPPVPEVPASAQETKSDTPAAAKSAEPAEAPSESAPEKTEVSEESEAADDPAIPKKIRDALKAIPDAKVRNDIRGDLRLAKDYKALVPISELKERMKLGPSMDFEKGVHADARVARNLRDAFVSGSPEGIQHFTQALRTEAPDAYREIVRQEVAHLSRSDPDAFVSVATEGARNLLASWRDIAKAGQAVNGWDADQYGTGADLLEQFLGLGQPGQKPPQRAEDPRVAELEQENQRYRAQQAEQAKALHRNFVQSVNGKFVEQLSSDIAARVDASNPDGLWTATTVERLNKAIRDDVFKAIRGNPELTNTTRRLLQNGRLDDPHYNIVLQHLVNSAKGLVPSIASDHIAAFRSEFMEAQTRREQKQAHAAGRRDIGAAGAPARGPGAPTVPFEQADPVGWLGKFAAARQLMR